MLYKHFILDIWYLVRKLLSVISLVKWFKNYIYYAMISGHESSGCSTGAVRQFLQRWLLHHPLCKLDILFLVFLYVFEQIWLFWPVIAKTWSICNNFLIAVVYRITVRIYLLCYFNVHIYSQTCLKVHLYLKSTSRFSPLFL